jgi:hypothetical protein
MRKVTLSGLVARVTLERFVRISIADELLAIADKFLCILPYKCSLTQEEGGSH